MRKGFTRVWVDHDEGSWFLAVYGRTSMGPMRVAKLVMSNDPSAMFPRWCLVQYPSEPNDRFDSFSIRATKT